MGNKMPDRMFISKNKAINHNKCVELVFSRPNDAGESQKQTLSNRGGESEDQTARQLVQPVADQEGAGADPGT